MESLSDCDLKMQTVIARILTVRGVQAMLDRDLAELYGVETKALNRAVKRNYDRFPAAFCFQLTEVEWLDLRFQSGTSNSGRGGRRYAPFVFTEQGVAMLSAVLHSEIAVSVSVQIMNAFVCMRRFMLNHANVFQRLDSLELRQFETIKKVDQIFKALESQSLHSPDQGIFFEGQIFDAYAFVSGLITQANQRIDLIDNYIDASVLTLLSKRPIEVKACIYCSKIGATLQLDLEKFNAQYPAIELHRIAPCHDRFLIIDDAQVYHIGASLKDLGKQCFAFSRMDSLSAEIRGMIGAR
jgi:hypothetical protein